MAERYMYDENGRLIAELNSAGKIISYFIYATRSHVPDYMVRLNVKYKLIHDHLGSVRFVVNASTGEVLSKIEYDEFGIVQPNPLRISFQPFGFAGGIYDASLRLLKFGARDYEPQTGRWLSKDPILFSGGDTNLYGYVLQDPVNFIDPSGLILTNEQIAGAVGGALGGAATGAYYGTYVNPGFGTGAGAVAGALFGATFGGVIAPRIGGILDSANASPFSPMRSESSPLSKQFLLQQKKEPPTCR